MLTATPRLYFKGSVAALSPFLGPTLGGNKQYADRCLGSKHRHDAEKAV